MAFVDESLGSLVTRPVAQEDLGRKGVLGQEEVGGSCETFRGYGQAVGKRVKKYGEGGHET